MHRLLISAALFSILTAGCGHAGLDAQRPAKLARGASAGASRDASAARGDAAPDADTAAGETRVDVANSTSKREPGDFVAYRFSGSFRRAPLTLTQRVVAREGDLLIVDLTLEGGKKREVLRVRMSDAPSTRGEIVSVASIAGAVERPAPVEAYEAMMAKTALAADANDEVLGTETVALDVAGAPLLCQKTSYRVRIGNTKATMRTLQSEGFAWGDVGGDITDDDGHVLYRAELIDAGHDAHASTEGTPKAKAVAQSDEE
jgi:hypothetical protein